MYVTKTKKYVLLFSFILAFFGFSNHAQAATCNDQADGNWNSASTWSCGAIPGSGDDVVIDSNTVTMTANQSVKSVTLNTGGTLTMQSYTLTNGSDWTVSGGALNAGTGTVKFINNTTNTFTPGSVNYYNLELAKTGGTLNLAGDVTVTNNLTSNITGGQQTINNNTIFVSSNIDATGTSSISGTTIIDLNGSGNQIISSSGGGGYSSITIDKPSGTLTLSGTIPVSKGWTYVRGAVDASTSTVKIVGAMTFTAGSVKYYNLTMACASSSTVTLSGNVTVTNNFTLSNGGISIINSGTIYVAGNVDVTTLYGYNSSTAIIDLNGSGNQTLSSSGGGAYSNINIDKPSGTLTLSGIIPITNNWTYIKGNVNTGTSTVKFLATSTFTPGSVKYYNVMAATTSGGTITLASNLVVTNTLSITTSGTTISTSSSNYSVTTKDFTQTAGSFTANASSIIITGNFTRSAGSFNANTSTVSFQGINQTIDTGGALTFYNFYKLVNDSDTFTITAGANITIASGGTMRLWGKPEGKTLSVVSSTPGSAYNITKTGSWEAEYTSITDMKVNTSVTAAASSLGTGTSNVQVTKEFISTIRATGGDYTTLSAWNSAIGVNLTAPTTLVFSISSKTGTLPDNSSVTGGTSGATATLVHASTNNQILLKSISGTFQSGEQVRIDGSNYAVISDAGYGAIARVDCYPVTDTTAVNINNWSTDNTHFVYVRTPYGQRHNGVWDDSKYSLRLTSGIAIIAHVDYVRIDGLQIIVPNVDYSMGAQMYGVSSIISNCLIKGGAVSAYVTGIELHTNTFAINNIVWGMSASSGISAYGSVNTLINNTSYNNKKNFTSIDWSNLKNNLGYSHGSGGYDYGSTSGTHTNNLSSDASSPDSIYQNKTIVFIDQTNNNFHLKDSDTSAKNKGIDLSTNSAHPVIDDIDNQSRLALDPNAWSIGADQFYPTTAESIGGSADTSAASVAWYKFDEGVGSTANNSGSGGVALNGSLGTGSSSPTWTNNGKFGKALSFDGTNDYIEAGNGIKIDNSSQGTISAWVKYTSVSTLGTIFSYGGASGSGNSAQINFRIKDYSGTKYLSMYQANQGDVTVDEMRGSTALSPGSWYNVMVVSTGSSYSLYVNGNQETITAVVGSNNGDWFSQTTAVSPIKSLIGERLFGGSMEYPFNGTIDDVKIYNYALSADQVKREYNGGNVIQFGSSGSVSGTGAPTNAASGDYCVPGDTTSCAAPVGEWKMDDSVSGAGKTISDTSGNGDNGTTYGSAIDCTVQGKYGKGCKFNGVNNDIGIPDSSNLNITSNTITLSVWMLYSSTPTYDTKIIYKSTSSENIGYGFADWTTSRKPSFFVGVGTNKRVASANSLDLNKWYHLVGVYDGSNLLLYINGKLDNSLSGVSGTIGSTAVYTLNVGAMSSSGTQCFPGKLDQVRVYNYARTASQIAWEYNKGKPMAWWKMDENVSGNNQTIHDNAPAYNLGQTAINGTTNWGGNASGMDCTVAGKYSKACSFDGTDDYISIGATMPAVNTVSLWIKPSSTTQSIIDLDGGSHKISISSGAVTATGFNSYYVDGKINGTIGDTNWHHITAVANSAFTTTASLKIGAISTAYYSGYIDDVKLFNYALTSVQVQTLYNASAAINFGN